VHFYDVGQGLSVLVDLPDGRHVLVDAGDEKARAGCGEVCSRSSHHLDEMLARDLHGAPLDVVWITHQHSDHVGGVPAVLARFPARVYVDNGRDLTHAEIKHARAAAEKVGARIVAIDPEHPVATELTSSDVALKMTAIVPRAWPSRCKSDQNDCSIMLRIDYCASSLLFTGDAEIELEKLTDLGAPVTLLQVGHHGSNTSSSEAFLSKARPRYAVISSGKPREGLNAGYCHPRASAVRRLTQHVAGAVDGPGGPAANGGASDGAALQLIAYDRDDRCDDKDEAAWVPIRTSANVYSTARDGDVVLVTKGDGTFARAPLSRLPSNLAH
jgi:competence protein ComEC